MVRSTWRTRLLLGAAALALPTAALADPVTVFFAVISATESAMLATVAYFVVANATSILLVTSLLYGAYRKRQATADARAAFNKSQRDRVSMVRSATEPRQILVGRDRLSGPLVYMASWGANKEYLYLVVPLGGHVFDAIETIYFGDEPLPTEDGAGLVQSGKYYKGGTPVDRTWTNPALAASVTLPYTPTSIVSVTMSDQPALYPGVRTSSGLPVTDYTVAGNVVTITSGVAKYYTVNYRTTQGGEALVRIRRYTGTQTAADSEFVAECGGEWTTAHVGYGVPYLAIRIKYDPDVFRSVGIPNVSAVCRGAVLYDPRLNRNPGADLVGAVVGTPGTLPTGLAVSGFNAGHGLVTSVVGFGTDRVTGLPYVDFRVAGTASASSNFQLSLPVYPNGPAASVGQTWTARITLRVVAGAWTFAGGSQLQVMSLTAAGAGTVEGSTSMPALASGVTNTLTRTQALASAAAASVISRIRFTYNAGNAYDVTLRVMLPELFPGAIGSAADCRRWAENAALGTAWWLREPLIGAGAQWDEVPTAELVAEANVCDEAVALVSGSQARYTANGTLYCDMARRDILESLLSAMAGSACWIQGRWLVRAGAYEVPEMTISAANLAQGDIRIAPRVPRRDLYNVVTGKYTDAASGYIERQQPEVTNPVYVAQDGGRRWAKDGMEHPMVREAIRAQRLAKIDLEGLRQAMSVTLTCNLTAWAAMPGRTVYLDLPMPYGISMKPMLVAERTYIPAERRIRLSMVEISANTYAWNYGNATLVDPAPNSTLPATGGRPAAPTNVTITPFKLGLSWFAYALPHARVAWDAPADVRVSLAGRVLLQHKRDDAADWTDGGVLGGAVTSTVVGPLDAGATSLVRVAFMDDRGNVSDWTVAVSAAAGVGGLGINTAMPVLAPAAKVWSGATSATLTLSPDGSVAATGAVAQPYYNPVGGSPGTGVWVRATKTGGNAVATGNYNAWQQLNAARAWTLSAPAGTYKTCSVLYEFALSSGGAVVATLRANFDVDAVNDTGGGGSYDEP